MALARIGAIDKGGVCRLALTDADRAGCALVVQWAREGGLAVKVEAIGNVFMRRAGRNAALPPVVAGSHIDTQPIGGKLDGNDGVLAALEVVRTLDDRGIETGAPVEAVFRTNEKGSRLVPVMMGSGVFAGTGHDAVSVARLVPTGMIFVPCKDDINQDEIEDARPEHPAAGCDVLLQVMLERAGVAARR